MNSLQEIESKIEKLTPREFEELSAWIEERNAQFIDQKLEADLKAGRMSGRIQRALAEDAAGQTRNL